MRALTLTQPWATAVALGLKHVETRSWATTYRGPLAIHAAKSFPRAAREFAAAQSQRLGKSVHELPLGAMVAICDLIDVVGVETVLDLSSFWGDFSPGRYAWILENVWALPVPIQCKGALGLWSLPAEVDRLLHVAVLIRAKGAALK